MAVPSEPLQGIVGNPTGNPTAVIVRGPSKQQGFESQQCDEVRVRRVPTHEYTSGAERIATGIVLNDKEQGRFRDRRRAYS